VQHHSLFFLHIHSLDTIRVCFGLTGHLQVYRLWLRILLLTVVASGYLVMWVTTSLICPWVARGCFWFYLVSLVVAALNVLAKSGVLLCVGRIEWIFCDVRY
jgi:hypothetical protein